MYLLFNDEEVNDVINDIGENVNEIDENNADGVNNVVEEGNDLMDNIDENVVVQGNINYYELENLSVAEALAFFSS